MKTSSLKVLMSKTGDMISKNSPTILTTLGVMGFLTSLGLAIDAASEATYIIDQAMDQKAIDAISQGYPDSDLTIAPIDKFKLTWKCYIPTAIMAGVSIGCVVGANSINLRRNAALASLYSIVDASLKEYQSKVVETIGNNKEQKIRDNIAQDKLNKNPVSDKQIIVTGQGKTLCYDTLSGRYFQSDIETIRRVQNDFNHILLTEMYLSLNELYSDLGLEGTEMGRDMGWSLDFGMLDISFSSMLATDGTPCLVLSYRVGPRKL